jgi:hypothetical protein
LIAVPRAVWVAFSVFAVVGGLYAGHRVRRIRLTERQYDLLLTATLLLIGLSFMFVAHSLFGPMCVIIQSVGPPP